MPPKAKVDPKAKKAHEKAKADAKKKVVEDKTFGMKNKNKSTKVQQYIQKQVNQVENQGKKGAQPQQTKKDKKKIEEERQKELDALFKVAIKQPKLAPGVDPKSVLCEAFKAGQCQKGFKCKYSHDLEIGRKTQKINIFTDQRDEQSTMEDWDQEELEKVVSQKHSGEKTNKTSIICKYFLDALESKQYGWFWKCPNGNDCQYRHALPPGYVLKSQMKELLAAEQEKQPDITETIEAERQQVDAVTRITEEVFKQWHASKFNAKREARENEIQERRKKGILSGREIFLQAGFTATDDASASEDYSREVDAQQEEKEMRRKAQEAIAASKTAEDSHGTSADQNASGRQPGGPSTNLKLNEEDEQLFLDDDDDLEDEELEELEKQLAKESGG